MSDVALREIWRRVRLGGELRPLVCLAASAAAAALLAGIGIGVAYAVGMARPSIPGAPVAGDVRDDDVVMGIAIAGGLWLFSLIWLWRPAIRLRLHSRGQTRHERWTRPLLVSVGLAGAATVLSFLVDAQRWDDTDTLETGLWFVAGGVALVAWLPAFFDLERGRPVTGPDGRVNVHCPDCGYAMAGLHTAVCPECGRKFTLDELIRVQDYEALRGP